MPFCPGNVATTACDRGTVLRDQPDKCADRRVAAKKIHVSPVDFKRTLIRSFQRTVNRHLSLNKLR